MSAGGGKREQDRTYPGGRSEEVLRPDSGHASRLVPTMSYACLHTFITHLRGTLRAFYDAAAVILLELCVLTTSEVQEQDQDTLSVNDLSPLILYLPPVAHCSLNHTDLLHIGGSNPAH